MPDYSKKLKKSIQQAYQGQGINTAKFANFDIQNDTIIQGKSRNYNIAASKAQRNTASAAGSLAGASEFKFRAPRPKNESHTMRGSDYVVQKVYNKNELKKGVSPSNFKAKDEGAAKKMFGNN